jgi:adenylate cyclase class 2
MREIEVKAKLRNKAGFLAAADALGIHFGEAIIQDDVTYETDLPYNDPDWNIFRIRTQNDKQILTMKHKASDRSRDNHEYETVIEDANEIVKMLGRLGYSHGVRIRKQRRAAHYKDLELCLDQIDGLGLFVEAERLTGDDADADIIQDELWDVLARLGVGPDDRVHQGYDMLMHQLETGAHKQNEALRLRRSKK